MFGSFLIGILAVFAGLYIVLQSHSISSNNLTNKVVIPTVVRRDGVVFVSDGAKGIARDASIELTKLGYHVLVGVKSEEEKRSFVFESRKGLEVIIFDVADPTTLVKVVYRLRQLKRDLDRPIVGVVLNLADFIEDHLEENHYIDIELLDINYKALVKGPLRLLQSMLEIIKHQLIEDEERSSSRIHDYSHMIGSGVDSGIERGGVVNSSVSKVVAPLNAQALRVITLTADLSEDFVCGSKCTLQDSFVDLVDALRSDSSGVTNISLSTVHSMFRPSSELTVSNRTKGPSIRNKRYRRGGTQAAKEKVYEQQLLAARLKDVERYVLDKMKGGSRPTSGEALTVEGDDGEKKHMSYCARAVVHSLASPFPQKHYEESEH